MMCRFDRLRLCILLLALSGILLSGCGTRAAENFPPAFSQLTPQTETSAPMDQLIFNGTAYPLDVSELTVSTLADLSQLRYTTHLTDLTVVEDCSVPMDWSFLSGLDCLSFLEIYCAGGEADLRPLETCTALETIFLESGGPLEQLLLPAAPDLKEVEISLAEPVQFLDASACPGLETLHISAPQAPGSLRLGSNLAHLACTGFSPDFSALSEGPASLSLTAASDLTPLAACPRLKDLSLTGSGWDLTPLGETALETLRFLDCMDSELAAMNAPTSLGTLHLSDRYLTSLSPLDDLESVEKLFLYIDPSKTDYQSLFGSTITAEYIDDIPPFETIDSLVPLSRFLLRGGTMILLPDPSRQ